MNFAIRKVRLNNFRKFRKPLEIDGLAADLNIIIEPNETGKSTLLEALRAAFFVRHATRNQLASSYAPLGETVAPEVDVEFELAGDEWSISKRFLRSPSIEVRGPAGRTQGDAAEEQLQQLLGFERDTSRSGDVAAYGALGLLWVAQTEGLSVTPPGSLVRDSVRSTLEAEVGTILGGAAYERVRQRIDQQFLEYWTVTGRLGARQTAAKEGAEAAKAAALEASERLAALDRTFTLLEESRARLKLLERDMSDDADAATRTKLLESREIARGAALMRDTRIAEHAAAAAPVAALEDVQSRHAAALSARAGFSKALQTAKDNRAQLLSDIAAAVAHVDSTRTALNEAREARAAAKTTLAEAEARVSAGRRQAAVAAAVTRHEKLVELEQLLAEAKQLSGAGIPAETINELEALERSIATATAEVSAGSTRLTLVGTRRDLTLNGQPWPGEEQTINSETRIGLGAGAELIISPPAAPSSAAARLATLTSKLDSALASVEAADLESARARSQAARDAAAELKSLEAQIVAATPGDPVLRIAAGPEALKLFISTLGPVSAPLGEDTQTDLAGLFAQLESADKALARAETLNENAIEQLRELEEKDKPLAAAEAGAESDLRSAQLQVEQIEALPEFEGIEEAIRDARQKSATAAARLADAERNAEAFDLSEIDRKIQLIDARSSASLRAKHKLEMEIVRLEATVESEGGKGLAERAAVAAETVDAAQATVVRVAEEADTLKLLRDMLGEARSETSRTYVGPVARRAKRHIQRLLPGCELTFSDDLGLEAVIRGGVSEGCTNLSRGTQEQLAVLTRLAFADMLLEQGKPVSLILDDPFAYADDSRLDLMTEILTDAAKRMQVILLTCRERAFRHVTAHRLMLD